MSLTPLLKTHHLNIGYPISSKEDKVIQENINIALNSGELTALLGVNGIGKTSLLRTLAGIHQPLGGQIFIQEESLVNIPSNELATLISVVLTEKVSSTSLTSLETIRIGRTPFVKWNGKLTEEDNYWINKAIEYTDTHSLLDKALYQLSDGQLQRVMIARAIAQNTPIILLDEPANHLDLHHKVQLLKMLKTLATQEGKAILYSSHDIDLSLQLSDNLIILKEGFNTQGSPNELIKKEVFKDFFQGNHVVFSSKEKRFILLP